MTFALSAAINARSSAAHTSGDPEQATPFYARLDAEIVLVTSLSLLAKRARMERAALGTTAAVHASEAELVPLPWATGAVRLSGDLLELVGSGAPTDSDTGADVAGKGSRYTDLDSGSLYTNTGSKSAPTWSAVGGSVLPADWSVTPTGGLAISPEAGSGSIFEVNAVPSIGGGLIVAAADGHIEISAQSASIVLGLIRLATTGQINISAPDFIGFGPADDVAISPGGYLNIEGLGEVPPDDQVRNSNMVLWFDRTPGSAKVMCKARDHNGTIVTGVVATLS